MELIKGDSLFDFKIGGCVRISLDDAAFETVQKSGTSEGRCCGVASNKPALLHQFPQADFWKILAELIEASERAECDNRVDHVSEHPCNFGFFLLTWGNLRLKCVIVSLRLPVDEQAMSGLSVCMASGRRVQKISASVLFVMFPLPPVGAGATAESLFYIKDKSQM